MQTRVRDGHPRLVNHPITKDQHIEIERSRPPPLLAAPIAPKGGLDCQQRLEQRPRLEPGPHQNHPIEIARLFAGPNRFGLDDARTPNDHGRSERTNRIEPALDVGMTIAQIAPHRDVRFDLHRAVKVSEPGSSTTEPKNRSEKSARKNRSHISAIGQNHFISKRTPASLRPTGSQVDRIGSSSRIRCCIWALSRARIDECICETRDSDRSSVVPISFIVIPS